MSQSEHTLEQLTHWLKIGQESTLEQFANAEGAKLEDGGNKGK